MSNNKTISRPYATAAFSVAKSENQLSEWSVALKNLSLAVKNKMLATLIQDPSVTQKQLCDILNDFAKQKSIANFVKLLAEKKRLLMLPEISDLFEIACAKESGYLALKVTTATETDEPEKIKISEQLSKKFNSKLKIDFRVDRKIMGGMLVRSADWVWDDSIIGKLTKLSDALNKR